MLTMKHTFDGTEFVREIGSYVAKRQNGQLLFSVYDESGLGASDGVWGGQIDYRDGFICGTIYVMNSAGSTVATYRYWCDPETLHTDETPPELPADMAEAA